MDILCLKNKEHFPSKGKKDFLTTLKDKIFECMTTNIKMWIIFSFLFRVHENILNKKFTGKAVLIKISWIDLILKFVVLLTMGQLGM